MVQFLFFIVHLAECSHGTYGRYCNNPCGQCLNGDPCDPVSGTCTVCACGFKQPLCTEGKADREIIHFVAGIIYFVAGIIYFVAGISRFVVGMSWSVARASFFGGNNLLLKMMSYFVAESDYFVGQFIFSRNYWLIVSLILFRIISLLFMSEVFFENNVGNCFENNLQRL
jgi:hypothetical protein